MAAPRVLFAEAHERRQLTGESDRSDALRPIRIARAQFPIERSHGSRVASSQSPVDCSA